MRSLSFTPIPSPVSKRLSYSVTHPIAKDRQIADFWPALRPYTHVMDAFHEYPKKAIYLTINKE